jgi:hypothetical protein
LCTDHDPLQTGPFSRFYLRVTQGSRKDVEAGSGFYNEMVNAT